MNDPLQSSIRRLAYANGLAKRLAIFCAAKLIYLLYAGAALDAWHRRRALTIADAARSGLLLSLPVATGKALHRTLNRPRPFLRTGIPPLIQAEPRRGFPSDHTIQAIALVAQASITGSGHVPPRIVGALLVMLGRLGTNVHDSLDVLGGLGIASLSAWLIQRLPLPASWGRAPLLASVSAEADRSVLRPGPPPGEERGHIGRLGGLQRPGLREAQGARFPGLGPA